MTHRGPFQPLLFCDSLLEHNQTALPCLILSSPVTESDLAGFCP